MRSNVIISLLSKNMEFEYNTMINRKSMNAYIYSVCSVTYKREDVIDQISCASATSVAVTVSVTVIVTVMHCHCDVNHNTCSFAQNNDVCLRCMISFKYFRTPTNVSRVINTTSKL